jgi:hypothetical protein
LHALFFRESFREEIYAAGYTVDYRVATANYILNLVVRPNIFFRNDGIREQVPQDEKQFILQVSLVRNQDNAEIVAFTFPFSDTAEVVPYSQYLFYQVMLNLPNSFTNNAPPAPAPAVTGTPQPPPDGFTGQEMIIREVPGPERIVEVPVEVPGPERIVEVIREVPVPVEVEVLRKVPVEVEVTRIRDREVVVEETDDFWRNKLLYLRVSADFPVGIFRLQPGQTSSYEGNPIIVPGAALGLEMQFMNWMSAEVDFVARFADVMAYSFIPGAALQLKFPIKPTRYLMLEPYLAGAFLVNLAPHSDTPYLEAGGGFQFAMKAGQAGAWFIDLNYMHTLNVVRTKTPEVLRWERFAVGLSVGYKFGFVSRVK